MVEATDLAAYVAGARVAPQADAPRIASYDGKHTLRVAETNAAQLRSALRYADEAQLKLQSSPLAERIEVARLLVDDYARRADQACWALAHFRGITASDTRWMCQVNLHWAERFDQLAETMWGSRAPRLDAQRQGMYWRSRGTATLFSSSTMDGPPAVVAICHAILAGTHLIFRPSFRDAATQLAFETLHEHGLAHYAQLVRWRSEAPDSDKLNRQLVRHVAQGVIFSSNENYRAILDGAAQPGSEEWDSLRQRVKRYGTGLPLAVVTQGADLDLAARDLIEGARLGGGRFCLSSCPVLVDRRCHDALVERLVAQAQRLRAGSPMADNTELSDHDPADTVALRDVLRGFGGTHAFGAVRATDMDVVVLAQVPTSSEALHRELPGTALAVMPVDDLEQAVAVAIQSLRRNHREAWTALVCFADSDEFTRLSERIPAYRYLRGGVVARVKLQLPHQGAYFALDLMRRVTVE